MPILPGLCSVTLRALGIDEVVRVAAAVGLAAIEWGGDVHVPPGDTDAAAKARVAGAAAGLTAASYGSYLLADGDGSDETVARALDTAVALGAPNARVWAPFGVESGSPRTREVEDALGAVSAAAADRDLTVGLEFHGGTLTATASSAAALVDAVGAPNLGVYWQPPYWSDAPTGADDAADLAELGPRVSHLHVYEWAAADDRRPLVEGAARWQTVFGALADQESPTAPSPRVAFLEFVAGDDPVAVQRDAWTLLELLGQAS